MITPQWPKKTAALSEEQQKIRDDFMQAWLNVLPRRFSLVEKFNHRYPLRTYKEGLQTLEIGAGLGEHLRYEHTSGQEYVALELRPDLADEIRARYPDITVITGDCQERIDFPDAYFDRVLAIHILEHLPNLPAALQEIKRVLKPGGTFCVVIPCDPGFAYSIARNFSARPLFEKRYQQSYDWYIKNEHINTPDEIKFELKKHFRTLHQIYFPFFLFINAINLVIGMTLELL